VTNTEQTILDTVTHSKIVGSYILQIFGELVSRIIMHDESKLSKEELPYFSSVSQRLKELTYGSDEYKTALAELKPALDHHYVNNRHHPEHFDNGLSGMTLIDLIEMLADWKAATLRHEDGNLEKSFIINEKRFKISPQLMHILRNTAKELDW